MERIKTKFDIDEKALINTFFSQYSELTNNFFERIGFEKGVEKITELNLFATEKPSILFIDFKIESFCNDNTEGNRKNAVLKVEGDGKYDCDLESFENMRCTKFDLYYTLPDGTEEKKSNHFLYLEGICIGHKEASHTEKYKLE